MAIIIQKAVKHIILSCQAVISRKSRRAGRLFMQNKPNLLDAQMNVSSAITMNYEQLTMNYANKNKPNSNPIKPKTNPIHWMLK
jgi:hypothetical protein